MKDRVETLRSDAEALAAAIECFNAIYTHTEIHHWQPFFDLLMAACQVTTGDHSAILPSVFFAQRHSPSHGPPPPPIQDPSPFMNLLCSSSLSADMSDLDPLPPYHCSPPSLVMRNKKTRTSCLLQLSGQRCRLRNKEQQVHMKLKSELLQLQVNVMNPKLTQVNHMCFARNS